VFVDEAPATSGAEARFAWSAAETATFECSLDGDGWTPCPSPLVLSGFDPGEHTETVRAIDALGNPGTAETLPWTATFEKPPPPPDDPPPPPPPDDPPPPPDDPGPGDPPADDSPPPSSIGSGAVPGSTDPSPPISGPTTADTSPAPLLAQEITRTPSPTPAGPTLRRDHRPTRRSRGRRAVIDTGLTVRCELRCNIQVVVRTARGRRVTRHALTLRSGTHRIPRVAISRSTGSKRKLVVTVTVSYVAAPEKHVSASVTLRAR
jgi:hypothetical protein